METTEQNRQLIETPESWADHVAWASEGRLVGLSHGDYLSLALAPSVRLDPEIAVSLRSDPAPLHPGLSLPVAPTQVADAVVEALTALRIDESGDVEDYLADVADGLCPGTGRQHVPSADSPLCDECGRDLTPVEPAPAGVSAAPVEGLF